MGLNVPIQTQTEEVAIMVNAHKKAVIIGGQKAKNYSYHCA